MSQRMERLGRNLASCGLGRPLLILDKTASTNDVLKAKAKEGAPEGYTVMAEEQTEGRGRVGKKWLSLPGKGLYMSVLLRPANWRVDDSSSISMFSALAVAAALHRAGIRLVSLKWPNDVLVDGKKIAGILVEPETWRGVIRHCVIGVGINVSHSNDDLLSIGESAATSCALMGLSISSDDLLVLVLEELCACYRRAVSSCGDWLMEEWAGWLDPKSRIN